MLEPEDNMEELEQVNGDIPAPETAQGYISEVTCMDCNQVLVWPIAERTGIQDHTRLRCQTQSCKQFGKVWQRPVVKLWLG